MTLTPSEKLQPNLVEDDQGMELEPVIMGPPAYGSPDPNTLSNQLYPLADDPHNTAAGAADAAAASKDPNERKAGEWKRMVEAAADQDALDSLKDEYDKSDADFSTVEDAFDKKQDQLDEANDNS